MKMVGAVSGAVLLQACAQRTTSFEEVSKTLAVTNTPVPPPTAAGATSTPFPPAQPSATPTTGLSPTPAPQQAAVAFVKTQNRAEGVTRAMDILEYRPARGARLFLKPNFNSADPAPGSTHPEVLQALTGQLSTLGAGRLTVGDRSGMGDTRAVMRQLGVLGMAAELEFDTLVFDDLQDIDWELLQLEGGHWARGFALPRPVLAADGIIQACCLKTHRYGGHFTLSLKNSVGLAAKYVPGEGYNYMGELHNSPHQRRMIAEINAAYQPELVVLDGVEAFTDGGPARGRKVDTQVILASTDRVALDAVGVAILRLHGTTPAVTRGSIFEQEQIARAVELGLGVASPKDIEIRTDDPDSAAYAVQVQELLLNT